MTNERLEEIRWMARGERYITHIDGLPAIRELIAEIDRLWGEIDEERTLRRSWKIRCDEAIGAGKAICETAKQLNAENDLLQASAFKWERLHDECQKERDQWKAECEQLKVNIDDMHLLIRRMAFRLKHLGEKKIAEQAEDFLRRKGIVGSILREQPADSEGGEAEISIPPAEKSPPEAECHE